MLIIMMAALLTPPAAAQPPTCAAVATPAAPFAAWAAAHPVEHGFVVGRAADVPAVPVANVRLAVQPSRLLTGSHLATASFEVTQPGRYAVAVGGAREKLRPLWLDVAGADGKPLKSTGHGHGQACTSITKIVEFDLAAGRYVLLATGLTAGDQPVRALIVRKP